MKTEIRPEKESGIAVHELIWQVFNDMNEAIELSGSIGATTLTEKLLTVRNNMTDKYASIHRQLFPNPQYSEEFLKTIQEAFKDF